MSALYGYVDESVRPGRYLMAVVLVEPNTAGPTRATLQRLLLPRQRRLHFQRESRTRRKQLLKQLALLDVEAVVFACRHEHGRSERPARAVCLAAIVEYVQSLDREVTLFIERREGRDGDDHRVVNRTRRRTPSLDYHHILPSDDPLVWLPDCFAWAAGAGGEWLTIVATRVGRPRSVT